MKYVTRVLQPGESLVHLTRLHPIIFLPAVLWFAAAIVLLVAGLSQTGDLRIGGEALAVFCAIFGVASGTPALIRRVTTELAVTDRRVIYKSGVLARHTLEMNRSKVESVDVDQSLLGRMLGFGTITVRGTGGSLEPIRMIGDPLTFRSHITAG
ncbi:MAG TPA: PH domain-containing protein [Stellaceae bacterium]|nr:PH domain-containing protein [Stellaceae bacterium]